MDLNQKLLGAFQIEHVEHLEGIRSAVARLELGEADPSVLEEAFRCAHSLKGAARVIGLSPVETLAHHLESFFARLRDAGGTADKELLGVVQLTLDAIEDATGAFLRGEAVEAPGRAIEEATRLLGSEPPRALKSPEKIDNARERATDAQLTKPVGPVRLIDSVRLSAESLDRMLQSSTQLLTATLQQEETLQELHSLSGEVAALARSWQSIKRDSIDRVRDDAGMPPRPQLGQGVELIDQQFHAIARRTRNVLQLQQRKAWSNRQLAEQLRSDVRQARMVPAESIFQGFRKMMRDLAHDQNKEIDFRLSGMETEADRVVLQAIKDPLMHVLRNSVCHGIEVPADRASSRKATRGEVSLTITATGRELSIVVEDDGRGVDVRRVSQLAARRGLISKDSNVTLTDAELAALLVRPGFSTCETVTELAGRGLGLAIVQEAVGRLQGNVSIRSRDGGGTVVAINIPTTVSTHRILLVGCGGQNFGIPLPAIESVMRVERRAVENLEGRPILSMNGQLTPVADLASLLGISVAVATAEPERLTLVLLKAGGRRLGLAVDALLMERDSVIQRLGPPASKSPFFTGGTIQEDGSVCLVLDPAELFKRSTAANTASWPPVTATAKPSLPTILVVDDSVTTRTLETTILQSRGYQVRVAVNGLEALASLRAEPVDLVISDIQMPKLDGFGLLEAIKSDPKLSATPVIIVSSMESRDYQQRGLQLGADAYIVKRNFDHQELLQTIEQIV
jgi:two-component system chemotaxis sensor kinase CheA